MSNQVVKKELVNARVTSILTPNAESTHAYVDLYINNNDVGDAQITVWITNESDVSNSRIFIPLRNIRLGNTISREGFLVESGETVYVKAFGAKVSVRCVSSEQAPGKGLVQAVSRGLVATEIKPLISLLESACYGTCSLVINNNSIDPVQIEVWVSKTNPPVTADVIGGPITLGPHESYMKPCFGISVGETVYVRSSKGDVSCRLTTAEKQVIGR